MVQLQNYLKGSMATTAEKKLPMLNSLFIEKFSSINPYNEQGYKTYMTWARKCPQLMGFLGIIASDVLSDKIEFTPIEKNASGHNKVLKAQKFWNDNKGIEVAEETIYDLLINGIGYNWLGTISDVQIKEFCKMSLNQVMPNLEDKELKEKTEIMFNKIMSDEGEKIARKLRHVAASTMTILTDEYEVKKYIQNVGVKYTEFSPEEIITFKLMPLDGKVYPFPPMEALLSEVYLLWLISQNYVSYFENGGKPDAIFILPKEIAMSKNHQYLINELQKYKKIQNKHGNMVFTGDITIKQLDSVEKSMENKDLGLYLVGILAMVYGIPVSRIPFLVGKAAAGGDAGGLADSGYWRRVSVWQSKMEAAYNSALWNKYFGVNMKFNRGYLQDEVRETQNEVQRNSIAEQRINLGLWTIEEAGRFLGIEEEEIAKAQLQKKERMNDELKSGMLLQNSLPNRKVMPEPDNQKKGEKKSETQKSKV